MKPLVDNVTIFLSILTVFANVSTLVLLFTLLFAKLRGNKISGLPNKILNLASNWAIPVSFIIALVSTLGSLFFSEVAGYSPCVLCWYQRIFMYPLVLLFGVALLRKEKKYILDYAIPPVVLGVLLAGLHSLEQITVDPFLPCSTIGYAVSCTKFFFRTFGYITIPLMSLSAFAFILLLLLAKRAHKQ